MKSASEEMLAIYGRKGMKQPPTREELYEAFDLTAEALRSHKARIEALEGSKGVKPRVRVPAGRNTNA